MSQAFSANKSPFKDHTKDFYGWVLCSVICPEGFEYNTPSCPFVGHILLTFFSTENRELAVSSLIQSTETVDYSV